MSATDREDIRIVVSCHKESRLPDSELYLPVQVGAATAPRRLAGMQPDDEGAGISDRNFTFCELTAQYWAWRNLQADYVGLCHYRRFLCFGRTRRPWNDHHQVEVPRLDDDALREFRLEDEALVRAAVEGADLITGREWDVRFTRTPAGVKRSVAEHMAGYGLVSPDDLARLTDLVDELAPEYAEDVRAYLAGSRYLGYNCFLMRRDLFDRLCALEFPVLLAFDRSYSYEGLPPERQRICGYLGEILFSAFVRHVRAEGGARVAQRTLVFFECTDAGPVPAAAPRARAGASLADRLLPPGTWRRLVVGSAVNRLRCPGR